MAASNINSDATIQARILGIVSEEEKNDISKGPYKEGGDPYRRIEMICIERWQI
jgi:hypothetical protein